MKRLDKKTIILIILFVLFFSSLGIIGILIYKHDNKTNEIVGTVSTVGDGYYIVKHDDKDYLVKDVDGEYQVGDEIKITYANKNLDVKSNPPTIKSNTTLLVKKAENEKKVEDESTNNNDSTNNTNKSNNTIKNNTSNNTVKPNTSNEVTQNTPAVSNNTIIDTPTSADNDVESYCEDLKSQSNDKPRIKEGFTSVIDFIFYGGSIKGHTFSELSNTAKLKVLKFALYLDKKVDEYYPGYKENITSSTGKAYSSVKSTIVRDYLNITTKVCTNNSDVCTQAKQDFSEMKTDYSLTWNLLKSIAKDGISNLSEWYKIWRNK
jgi:hypothetical protein